MAVEGRREAVMDLEDVVILVLLWGVTLVLAVVGVWAVYVGRLADGCILALGGTIMAYSSIHATKVIWRLKNEAQD